MKKFRLILAVIISSLFLCSCFDYKEPNDLAYVIAIGIDEGNEENIYSYTLQFAKPTQISGGSSEEGGSGEETIGTVKVEAPSIYSAINVANHVISKSFTLSHTKIIVISKKISEKGIKKIVDAAGRSTELRPSVFLCVSDKEAGKYLESVKPVVEINPVKYYRLIFESPNSSYIPKNELGTVYANLNANTEQCALPLVGVGKGSKKESSQNSSGGEGEQKSSGSENQSQSPEPSTQSNEKIPINEKGFEFHMKEYYAGKLDIEKQNESEVIGSAIFKEDKLIGTLSGLESEMLNILSGRYTTGYSVIYVPKSPDNPATLRLEQLSKPKIDIKIDGDTPKIKISLSLEGNFMSVPSNYVIEEELSDFEETTAYFIKEYALEFLNKTVKEYNSDLIGFGKDVKKRFLTNKEFEEFNWNEIYKNAEFECDVVFSIRRTGLTMRSSKN